MTNSNSPSIMSKGRLLSLWLVSLGLALWVGVWLSQQGLVSPDAGTDGAASLAPDPDKPLYWVAPMDPNFRRDEPGLSPMGMELIPVYADDSGDSPGTIQVESAVMQSLGVTSVPVQRLPLVTERRVPLRVVSNPEREWMLMSRVDGWVEEQFVFRVGETVKQGDPLLRLYSPRLISAQEELLTAMASRRSRLIEASRTRLLALGMSPQWVRQLQRRGRVEPHVTIVAPQDGILTALDLQPGRRLTPQTHLLTLSDTSSLWLEADVYGRYGDAFEAGDEGQVSLAGQTWQQPVEQVYALLDEQGSYRVRLTLPNPEGRWQLGEWGDVLLRRQGAAVMQIPRNAVIDDGVQTRVVLALASDGDDRGRFKSVAVQIGRSGATDPQTGERWVEVVAGLETGDQVVTNGQFMLDSESSVSSDLLRYDPRQSGHERVWMTGTLAPSGVDNGRIVIRHQGIPEWRWPAMTQDYHLALPASAVTAPPGTRLRMELVALDDGDYCVTQLRPVQDMPPRTQEASHDHSHH